MPKYFASDKGLSQVDITGARTGITTSLKKGKDGMFNVESKMDAKALEQSGFAQASLMGVPANGVGYICGGCGFNGFFAECGRCGTNNKVATADETKVIQCESDCDNCDCESAE